MGPNEIAASLRCSVCNLQWPNRLEHFKRCPVCDHQTWPSTVQAMDDAEAGKLRAQAEFDQFCARRAVEADSMFAALELDFVADPEIRELEQRFNAQAPR